MKKSWAITFAIVVAVWIAFLVYRHTKNKEMENAYVQETYSSMTKSAMASPKAGLTFMGMAIKQYRTDTGHYPKTLDALYPNYIKDKSFVDEVPWEYSAGKDNFRLAKTVFINERPYTAYIDKQLRPTDVGEEKKVMVASAKKGQGQSGKTSAGHTGIKNRGAAFSPMPYAPPPERKISKEELEKSRKKLLEALAKMKEKAKEKKEIKPEKEDLGYLPVADANDVNHGIADKYFTWKTENGVLGFGNVTYPKTGSNLIYKNGKWIKIKKEKKAQTETTVQAESSKNTDIVEKYSKNFLAWKSENGAIGFGNVTYPEKGEKFVYHNGQWIKAQQKAGEKGSATIKGKPKPDIRELVKKYGTTFLAWKYKTGAIGFSDTMYPDSGDFSVYAGGKWVAAGHENPADVLANTMAYENNNTLEADRIAKKHGKYFYIWKEPNGTLGFSDFALPDKPGTEVLGNNGEWIKAIDTTGQGGEK